MDKGEKLQIRKQMRREIFHQYDGRCAYCGEEIGFFEMKLDEREEPLQNAFRSLEDSPEHFLPVCPLCSELKSGRDLAAFRQLLSRSLELLAEESALYRLAIRYHILEDYPKMAKEIHFYFEEDLPMAKAPEASQEWGHWYEYRNKEEAEKSEEEELSIDDLVFR